jgi:1,4-dihydroxy-2-naphthoyl-CoA hydrolase
MIRKVQLAQVNAMNKDTLMAHLGIEFVEIGEDFLVAEMSVDAKTHQPMGLLHGGASAALIESVGSMGSALIIDLSKAAPVGLEINANHLRGVKSGVVSARGELIHCGSKTHVWQVTIVEKATQKKVCVGRLTIMIVPHASM